MDKRMKLLEEVKEYLEDFEINLNDLQNPSTAFVVEFFVRLLREFEADSENMKRQQMIESVEVTSDEVEIIPDLNILSAVQYVCGRFEIGLFDILNPEQKKTMDIISNIMNFLKFADHRTSILNPQLDELQKAKDNLLHLQETKDELLQAVNALALDNDSVSQKINNLKEILKSNTIKFNEAAKEVESLKESCKPKKKELSKLKSGNLAAMSELEALNQEIKDLENQVVDDPEIEEVNLKRMEEAIVIVKEKKDEVWKKSQEQTEIINSYNQYLKDIENFTADLDSLKVVEEIKNFKSKIAEINEEINHAERNNGSNNPNKQTMVNDFETLINDLNNKLSENKRIYDFKTEELKSAKIKSKDFLDEINKLNDCIADLHKEKLKLDSDYQEALRKLDGSISRKVKHNE